MDIKTKQDNFVKHVNKLRLDNKNKWYSLITNIGGLNIRLKGYNTSIQILDVDGVRYGGLMDASVKKFNEVLYSAVKGVK